MANGGSGTSKNAQAISPQQLALLRGIAGNAPVAQAAASMPGQQGLLGQGAAAQQAAQSGGNPMSTGQMPGMQAPVSAAAQSTGMNPQMLQLLKTQYPQLFGGGSQ